MADELNVNTDGMRADGDADIARVPGIRNKAKPDEVWLANFHANFGFAADEYLTNTARPYMAKRHRGLNGVGDGFQDAGGKYHTAATRLEDTDIEGGSRIRREMPEV